MRFFVWRGSESGWQGPSGSGKIFPICNHCKPEKPVVQGRNFTVFFICQYCFLRFYNLLSTIWLQIVCTKKFLV
nr:MAG TPA: hypothetical protein [Caudoviricetes sp.]